MAIDPGTPTAAEAASLVRDGRRTAVDLVAACLDRIVARDGTVRAWAYVDPDHALRQAEEADARRRAGTPLGPLHGVPLGLSDVIDTDDMPTACGSAVLAGRRPEADAAVAGLLRAAGAVMLGKTTTSEFGASFAAATRHPRRADRSAGDAPAGSAAAVADAMVPAALAIDGLGEVTHAACWSGVYGYVPSFGLVPRTGAFSPAASLDRIGVFARSLEDLALIGDVLHGHDAGDPATRPRSRSALAATASAAWPIAPTFALVKSPGWAAAAPATREAIVELCAELGPRVVEIDVDAIIADALRAAEIVRAVEAAAAYGPIHDRGGAAASDALRQAVARGRAISAVDYLAALETRRTAYRRMQALFDDHGTVLTAATIGPAPEAGTAAGDTAFAGFWSFLGAPQVTLPLFEAEGLPFGLQLVGARGDDGRLLRSARLLLAGLAEAG